MFSFCNVRDRKHQLHPIWIAVAKKVDKKILCQIDIVKCCEKILNASNRMNLRLSAILLEGVATVYKKKVNIYHGDANRFVVEINKLSRKTFQNLTGINKLPSLEDVNLDYVDDTIRAREREDRSNRANAKDITLVDDFEFNVSPDNYFERFDEQEEETQAISTGFTLFPSHEEEPAVAESILENSEYHRQDSLSLPHNEDFMVNEPDSLSSPHNEDFMVNEPSTSARGDTVQDQPLEPPVNQQADEVGDTVHDQHLEQPVSQQAADEVGDTVQDQHLEPLANQQAADEAILPRQEPRRGTRKRVANIIYKEGKVGSQNRRKKKRTGSSRNTYLPIMKDISAQQSHESISAYPPGPLSSSSPEVRHEHRSFEDFHMEHAPFEDIHMEHAPEGAEMENFLSDEVDGFEEWLGETHLDPTDNVMNSSQGHESFEIERFEHVLHKMKAKKYASQVFYQICALASIDVLDVEQNADLYAEQIFPIFLSRGSNYTNFKIDEATEPTSGIDGSNFHILQDLLDVFSV